MNKRSKNIFSDIALMRPIMIISIVIGHAFTIYTNSNSWPLPVGCDQINFLSWVNPVFISVALQAFVFISGYLFAYKLVNNPSIDTITFITGKFKRIYIPSILFSIFYVFMFCDKSISDHQTIYEIVNGAGHLWFLPMLFWCYVLGILTKRLTNSPNLLMIGILTVVSLLSLHVPDFLRIAKTLQYFIYFVLGIWTYKNKTRMLDYVGKHKYLIYLSIIVLIFLCCSKVYILKIGNMFPYSLSIVNIALGVIGSLLFYIIINRILIQHPGIVNFRNDIWYGMYIYHQFIMMYLYYNTSISQYLLNYTPYVVLLITLIGSYVLVRISLKTRIGRWLIG